MNITIKDVAKKAGVGVGTVSRVLNGKGSVNEKTKKRIEEAIKELHYRPNRMASRLKNNETKVLTLCVPVINHPFFAKLTYFIEDEADKNGYTLLLASSQNRVEKESEIIERIKRREVDGAIFVTHYAHEGKNLSSVPIVSFDRHFGENVPYVTSDNYDATSHAIKYLIDRGCKKIGYIGTRPLVESDVMDRERAYRDVIEANGLETYVKNENVKHGDEKTLAKEFFDKYEKFDAVFVSGYSLSQAIYREAVEREIKIPEDMQLVSYDGLFDEWGIGKNEDMTCVEQPIEEMARALVQVLLKKIRKKQTQGRIIFKSNFHIGKTTK